MSEFARELTDLIESLADGAREKAGDDVWARVCDLGLAGIGVPEEEGGSGGSLADLIVVIRELARAGLSTPIVEASTAGYAVGAAPGASFDTIVVMPDVDVVSDTVSTSFAQVPFADTASGLVMVATSSVVTVPLAGESVTVEPGHDIAGVPYGSVRLDEASVSRTAGEPTALAVLDRLALTRSAGLVGNAWGAYDLTRSYVTQREQFDAPLIKIPAVSTALAQMAVRIRFAESALDRATAVCADPDAPALRRFGAVSAARVSAATTATLVARSSHQLHGAVGITAEYGLHGYTSTLWALRDADESQFVYCRGLGAKVRAAGEVDLWEYVSA
jgi:acyl-CoA dehydrogenase